MRRQILTVLLTVMALTISAQSEDKSKEGVKEKKEWLSTPKFSGYFIGTYTASFQEGNESNVFNIRILRLMLKGKILGEFEYTIQGQANGNTQELGSSPRIVDVNLEWQRYPFFRVKAGQQKIPFTLENPMNPIDVGYYTLAQNVTSLSEFNDRSGSVSSNGRDIGVVFQGDFLADGAGRNQLHYEVGVFNGQGINQADVDQRKDIIGGITYSPLKGLRFGIFGWEGSYARKGLWTDREGVEHNGLKSLARHRYALSAEYKDEDWQLRTEYIHHTGYGFKNRYQSKNEAKDAEVDWAAGDKADGIYATVIAPIIPGKLRAKARYDMYRPRGEWDTSCTRYDVGLNYLFHKNIEIQTQYTLVNDRSLEADHHNYSVLNAQLCVRF